jgi:hypothetical protein
MSRLRSWGKGGRLVFLLSQVALGAVMLSMWSGMWDEGAPHHADTKSYVGTAKWLVGADAGEAGVGALRPPVYPLFLVGLGIPEDDNEFRQAALVQTLMVWAAACLFAWVIFYGWASAWAASIPLWVLLWDTRALVRVASLLSESMALFVALLVMAAFAYTLLVARGRSKWAWCLAGFLVAALPLTRVQYLPGVLCMFPVLIVLWSRHGRWRVGVMLVLLLFLSTTIGTRAFLSNAQSKDDLVSRAEKFRWIVIGKMIAPHFYEGPKNAPMEQTVAVMWNEAFRKGRTGAEFPRAEWLYVRQNWPEFQREGGPPFGPNEWDVSNQDGYDLEAFSDVVKGLDVRSLKANGLSILLSRFGYLRTWVFASNEIGFERNFHTMSASRLVDDIFHFRFRVIADGVTALGEVVRTNRTWMPVVLIFLFGPFYFWKTVKSGREWLFLAAPLLFVVGDLLFIGLFYQGYKARFKMLDLPVLWMIADLMIFWVLRDCRQRKLCAAGAPDLEREGSGVRD